MEMKRVGIYCRVSTKEQTTENQLQDLRRYAQARGWQVMGEYVDEGTSGAKDNRPQLKAVMEMARKRKIDTLLVWRYDRFARSLSHLVSTLEELRALRVDFVSYQEGVDTSSPQGRMVFGVMASLAEFERELIRERVLSGLRRAKLQGKAIGRPRASFDASRARSLALQGASMNAIGKMLGVSRMTVARALHKTPTQTQWGALVGSMA